MIRIQGRAFRRCDGVSRRRFLEIGAAGFGALTLPSILRAEAASGRRTGKSVINVHLDGGPPHMDMIDLKPGAPSEYRGEFRPIPTALDGLQVCEHLPKLASIADRFAFIRSLVGSAGKHDAFQCQSGFDDKDLVSVGGRPAMGSAVSKLLGSPGDPVPAFVDLMQGRGFVRDSMRPGFLGPAYKAFRPDMDRWFSRPLEDGMKLELGRRAAGHTAELDLVEGLTAERLGDRTRLLSALDGMKREIDAGGSMEALDRFTQQALSILSSGRLSEALDLEGEDPKVLSRYTPGGADGNPSATSEGPLSARKFLLARRLVEAGVRCVSVSLSDFDTHGDNYPRLRHLLPILDTGLHALVMDLEERGMLGDVAIVVWGEFGRTPKVNDKGGRDHWPRVSPAILAGGGLRVGQVIGGTDRWAGEVSERPVHFQDVIATLYRVLGVDPRATTLTDPSGRPQFLVDGGAPIRELL